MILKKKQTDVEAMLGHRGKGFLAGGYSREFEGVDRKTSGSLVHPAFERLTLAKHSIGYARSPNKLPEPTAGSVTPRASLLFSELNQCTIISKPARVVPAPAVAHL